MPSIYEIAKAAGIKDEDKVLELLKTSDQYKNLIKSSVLGGTTVEGNVNEIADYVRSAEAAKAALAEVKKAEKEKAEKEYNSAIANVMITPGYSFDGYKIVKYSGYISGDDSADIYRAGLFLMKDVGQELLKSLSGIRSNALKELKEAAFALGCNAIIGVDFDYITLDSAAETGQNRPFVVTVTANGTAVKIEKE